MTKIGSQYTADAAMASLPKAKGKGKAVKDSATKIKTAVNQRAKPSKKGVFSLGNLFTSLPAELRQEIFFQALRKPNIHHLVFKRGVNPDDTWYPYCDPKRRDNYSGYRFAEKLKLVSDEVKFIARINNMKPMGIPSYNRNVKNALMDVDNDLISFEFATTWDTGMFGGWGLGRPPFLSRGLNREQMIQRPNDTLAHVKRIAIHFRHDRQHVLSCRPMPFPCRCNGGWRGSDYSCPHTLWRFCTIECAGFLDCFPSLEEVYFILQDEPQLEDKYAVYSSKVKEYAKNFWSVPQHARKELGYAVFHEARRSYIELDPRLAVDFKPGAPGLAIRLDDGSYMFPTKENIRSLGRSRMKVDNRWREVNNYHDRFGFYPQNTHHGHLVLKQVLKHLRLDMLRDPGFEADQKLDQEITLEYALTREQRLALKFKVLIRTDGECKGWPLGDPRGDLLRNISSKELVEQTYDLEDEDAEDDESGDGESEDDESEGQVAYANYQEPESDNEYQNA